MVTCDWTFTERDTPTLIRDDRRTIQSLRYTKCASLTVRPSNPCGPELPCICGTFSFGGQPSY